MTTPKYTSPDARLKLLNSIKKTLYYKTRARSFNELYSIIKDNSELCGNDQKFLTHLGKIYNRPGTRRVKGDKTPINLLHNEMKSSMKKYLDSIQKIDEEESLVLGYIRKLMAQTSYAEDLYKLLPNSLHSDLSKNDRLFFQGDGQLTDLDINTFLDKNNKYVQKLKARMAYNLLDVVEV